MLLSEASHRIHTHTNEQCAFCDNHICAEVHVGDVCCPQLRTSIVPDVAIDKHDVTEEHVKQTRSCD